jgi:hypothetical protein
LQACLHLDEAIRIDTIPDAHFDELPLARLHLDEAIRADTTSCAHRRGSQREDCPSDAANRRNTSFFAFLVRLWLAFLRRDATLPFATILFFRSNILQPADLYNHDATFLPTTTLTSHLVESLQADHSLDAAFRTCTIPVFHREESMPVCLLLDEEHH